MSEGYAFLMAIAIIYLGIPALFMGFVLALVYICARAERNESDKSDDGRDQP